MDERIARTVNDVSLELMVELGTTSMKLKEVLELGEASVIELQTKSGDPHKMKLGDAELAEGEIDVIDDKFFYRIKGIISPDKRMAISHII